MSVSDVDGSPSHLYPVFMEKIERVIETANKYSIDPDSGKPKFDGFKRWRIFEGYRSTARQLWLYAQGRTRQGGIVTNVKTPKRHGFGLAADIVWEDTDGKVHWDGANEMWDILGHCARAEGLEWGGDWKGNLGDKGHIQVKDADFYSMRADAVKHLSTNGLSTP